MPVDRDTMPPTCAWHSDEIEALKEGASDQTRRVGVLESDMRLLLERIPAGLAVSLNTLQLQVGQALAKQVSRDEFDPVKRLAYGAAGIILTAVILALVGLVLLRFKP